MEKINPRVDLAFKKIFGVEENKDLLISLINSIVSDEDKVTEVTLLNPYNPQNFKSDKLSILDIKALSQEGKKFNIEIQISDEADYDKRALYYWGKIYTEQLEAGDGYSELSKAIGIHILNFTSIPETGKYHNSFHITEKEEGFVYFKDLELHTIELKKFSDSKKDDLNQLVSKVKDSLDIWLAFLTRHDLLNANNLPKELDTPALKKAIDVLNIMRFTPEERESYDNHLKWLKLEASTLKKHTEQAREEGIQIGEARGEARGIEKTAIKMLKQQLDLNLISSITGLSKDELLKLKNRL